MQQAGVIVSDYATLMVAALADNAAPQSGALYAALDKPFAVLAGRSPPPTEPGATWELVRPIMWLLRVRIVYAVGMGPSST